MIFFRANIMLLVVCAGVLTGCRRQQKPSFTKETEKPIVAEVIKEEKPKQKKKHHHVPTLSQEVEHLKQKFESAKGLDVRVLDKLQKKLEKTNIRLEDKIKKQLDLSLKLKEGPVNRDVEAEKKLQQDFLNTQIEAAQVKKLQEQLKEIQEAFKKLKNTEKK